MATVTNFANAFETTLTADMLGTDLTAQVQTTDGAPSSPCYLVIDPHDDDKREYVLFDGAFGTDSFATTDIANRYLDGSAAASGITHAAGAIVRFSPVAQHFRNIQNSAVWLDETQTISGAKTFSVDPTLADGSSALSQTEGNAAYQKLAVYDVTAAAYGATGDGVADDTTEVQAAITAASDAGGGAVLFPEGTFLVTGITVPSNVRLVGQGQGASTIKLANASNTELITNSDTTGGNSNIHISHLTLDGNKANQTGTNQVISFRRVTRGTVESCRIINASQDGIYVGANAAGTAGTESLDVRVVGCTIEDPDRNGISVTGGKRVVVESSWVYRPDLMAYDFEPNTGLVVENCGCISSHAVGPTTTTAGGGFVSAAGSTTAGAEGTYFIDCHVTGMNTAGIQTAGFWLRGTNDRVEGGSAVGVTGSGNSAGVLIDSAGEGIHKVTGTVLDACTKGVFVTGASIRAGIYGAEVRGSASIGIQVETSTAKGRISGCTITNSGSQPAIRFNDAQNWSVIDCKAFDDQGTKTQTYGVVSLNTSDNLTVIGNDFRDNATGHVSLVGSNNLLWGNKGYDADIKRVLTGTATWDAGAIADGVATWTTVTVVGAVVGDPAVASHTALGANTVLLSAHVSSTDTVRVMLMNKTGASFDLASGTLRASVFKF